MREERQGDDRDGGDLEHHLSRGGGAEIDGRGVGTGCSAKQSMHTMFGKKY